jgi:fructose-bisphosphate aldolase class I
VPSTEENRRAYREVLFTTPGIEAYISGIILYDETIRQKAQDGAFSCPFDPAGHYARHQG